MSDNTHDTQFQGFADAVFEEMEEYLDAQNLPSNLPALYVSAKDALRAIIARRAYDLVGHAVGYSLEYLHECGREIPGGMKTRIVPSIPDMRELPKEQQ